MKNDNIDWLFDVKAFSSPEMKTKIPAFKKSLEAQIAASKLAKRNKRVAAKRPNKETRCTS